MLSVQEQLSFRASKLSLLEALSVSGCQRVDVTNMASISFMH